MSSEHRREAESGTPRAARPRGAARFRTGLRGLIVVVACFGLLSWAARTLWESQHPAMAAARALRSPDPSDRENAARQLMSLGMADPSLAIAPLIDAMGDTEASVRVAVVEALGAIGVDAARTRTAGDSVREATAGLIRSLGDREP